MPLPPPDGRAAILHALTRRTPLAPDVDLGALGTGTRTEGFSGADLAALVREAAVMSLKVPLASILSHGFQVTICPKDISCPVDAHSLQIPIVAACLALKKESCSHLARVPDSRALCVPLQEALQAESAAPDGASAAAPAVHMRHFQAALGRVQPSVNAKDQRVYSALRQRLRR